MHMRMCIFEDRRATQLHPLTLTRPVFNLRCGITSLAEKQRRHFGSRLETGLFVRPYLVDLAGQEYPFCACNDIDWLRAKPTLMVNGRWLPPVQGTVAMDAPHVGVIGKQVAYAYVPSHILTYCSLNTLDDCLQAWRQTLPEKPAGGTMIDYAWELVEHNATALATDFAGKIAEGAQPGHQPGSVTLLGPKDRLFVHETADLEPHVTIDTRRGPVYIDREAQVQSFTRIEGPCYIGPRAIIAGAKIRCSSIGPECRIGGEVDASICQAYVNKQHDGHLGHSYVGEWVNIAAGTQVGNLRNDYQSVVMTVEGNPVNTGSQKVGSFMGDHAKIGLGVLLNTGCSIGAFANVFPEGTYAPRSIPSFSIVHRGSIRPLDDLQAVFKTAAEVFARRQWSWSEAYESVYRTVFHATGFERRKLLQRERPNERRHSSASPSTSRCA